MVLNVLPLGTLMLAGAVAVTAFAQVPRDGLHPLALLASLLPLQLAALLVVLRPTVRAAEPRPRALKPPASG